MELSAVDDSCTMVETRKQAGKDTARLRKKQEPENRIQVGPKKNQRD